MTHAFYWEQACYYLICVTFVWRFVMIYYHNYIYLILSYRLIISWSSNFSSSIKRVIHTSKRVLKLKLTDSNYTYYNPIKLWTVTNCVRTLRTLLTILWHHNGQVTSEYECNTSHINNHQFPSIKISNFYKYNSKVFVIYPLITKLDYTVSSELEVPYPQASIHAGYSRSPRPQGGEDGHWTRPVGPHYNLQSSPHR